MYDVIFEPTPKYVPSKWETTDLGEFVQYDPKFFEVVRLPDKLRMGLKCIRPKGRIPQPVGLTDYSYMFADTKIGSVDMTGWDFSAIQRMAGFYMNCKRMDECKCDGINFSRCSDFYRMFYNCDGIERLDVHTWMLDEVSIFSEMCAECTNLEYFVCAGINVTRLDETTAMFENCISLQEFDCTGWYTPDLNSINRMFKGCKKLRIARLPFNNVKGLRDADRLFTGCRNLREVVMPNLAESENCTLYLAFDGTPLPVRPYEYTEFMQRKEAEKAALPKNGWF